MTFQPPTVVAKLLIYHSLLNKQAPLPPEKAGNKNQKLILFSQGAAISGAPNFGGVGQFPKFFPLIKIGIPVKKIITKAWAVTMTLYSWSFPNEGPDWPRSLRISILRPVPSIPLHAPVIKYRIPRLIIEYRSRAVLNSLLTRTLIKWGNGPL